jgi:hypothetical protein
MSLDDETLLSAYLDGELDLSRRLAVESALLANPRLAERLQDIAGVRRMVGDLPRPTPDVDLSPAILGQVAAWEAGRFRPFRSAGKFARRHALVITTVGIAASLLLVALIHPLTGARLGPARKVTPSHSVSPGLIAQPASKSLSRPEAPKEAPHEELLTKAPAPPAPVPVPIAEVSNLAEQHALRQQQLARALMERDTLRRILITADTLEPTAGLVEEAIGQTGRRLARHARYRVCQGVEIDPRHPGEAIVFTVVLDETEHQRFLEKLAERFPQSIEESEARPEVVTQLADIGQVEVFDGTPAGTLRPAPEKVTAMVVGENRPPQHVAIESVDPATGHRTRMRPSASNVRRGPSNAPAPSSESPRRDALGTEDEPSAVYVVWVTTRPAARR